jgi:hypothetical protein
MPRQHDVDVLEHTLTRHVDLATHVFFSRRAEELDRPLERAVGNQPLDRGGGAQAGGAEHVVAAAVAGRAFDQGFARRLCLLRDAGERVVLAHDADDRRALAELGDERRWQPGDAARDAEACLFGVVGE